MTRRFLATALVLAAVAGVIAAPGTARAETCVPVPVSTIGVTIEVGDEDIRVPAISGVAVCAEIPGTPGIPWVNLEPNGGVSVVITAGSSNPGWVVLKYSTDGAPQELRVAIPGTGGGTETCLVGVGFPARADCTVKISPDPLVTPSPLPTVPPVPTVPPLPTVPPVPTLPPIPTPPPTPTPDPLCIGDKCVPYGGTLLQEPLDRVLERLNEAWWQVQQELEEFLRDPCSYVFPHMTCN